jgi:FkbM family methyltransferase
MCKNPRIFAFEPIPPTFDMLQTNVSLYDLDVKLFELGMADKVDTASFTFYREAAGLSGRTDYAANDKQTTKTVIANWFKQVAAGQNLEAKELDEFMDHMMIGETFDCRLSTLSNVIRENGVERIDLLKVDVEGGELDVLNGIEEADWSRIRQVVVEVDTEELLRQISFKLETHGFNLAVDKTTTVREGAEYVYTVYATRTPQNGNSNGARPVAIPPLSTTELRSFLKERLPEYMVPSTFVTLEALPLTPNGKVNRQALPAPETGRRASDVVYEAPRTEAEQIVSEIWRDVLHVEQVGVNDNFFDLGGNSLLLVKVHSKLQEAFSKKISMVEMFRRATVLSLSSYLVGGENGKSALKQTQTRAQKQTTAINTQRELMKHRAHRVLNRKR